MKSEEDFNVLHKSTRAIHEGGMKATVFGEVSPPIFQSAVFAFSSAEEGAARFSGESPGYIYTRLNNPTVNALEENVASLERGFAGIGTATGMAAVTTVYLAFLDQHAHIVATDSLYSASRVVLETELSRFGVESTFVDSSETHNIEQAVRPNTRVIFIETPSNPTMNVTDLRGAADIAHEHRALLVVDNTFASPYLQRPLEHGADLVVHSLTKLLNGHSDVVGGMVVVRTKELYQRVRRAVNLFGGTMDPHQAWLVLRGIRTLPLRVEKSQENAMKLAEFLKGHRNVTWVRYPGLPEHPQHAIARRQMDGFGTILCFGVKKGREGGRTVMNNVRLITLAVSLGGVESLIEHPASMTHAQVPREQREKAGILDELIRFSVGCEDYADLRNDLEQALNRIP